ncbi:MAG: DNA-3-methyladenine glycosylase [Clostridia bacterium]
MKLNREFYLCDGIELSRKLLGKVLVRKKSGFITAARIVETEAYMGEIDKAAHSYKRKTDGRCNIQYGVGGFAYVYLIYGMYSCFNVVANAENVPEVSLVRALEPLRGIDEMMRRRNCDKVKNLCSGPGKLCMAMDIDRSLYGADLCGDELYIEDDGFSGFEIEAGKRINIDYAQEAAEFPWRFTIKENKFLSR